MKVFYTYLWLREDGTPYYAGKGNGDRASAKYGHRFTVPPANRILIQEFPDEASAFMAEKFLISFYGRMDLGTGCLRNLADGGAGASGAVRSEETRKKIARSAMGHKRNLGRKHSAETITKMIKAQEGRERPHLKGNAHVLGKHWRVSEEGRRHISEGKKGNQCKLGFKDSEETRRRKREAGKIAWLKRSPLKQGPDGRWEKKEAA